ncbi:MAG: response regulator transcription factor [Bacteroidota bacterium]|nr:response regulator transcription factor [Bacteroidota bacterium]
MTTSKINILIVEDEQLFRKGLTYMLQKYNINTIGLADNGEQALEFLKECSPDIVLLDLEMPVLNGSKTLNKIMKSFPKTKVIIISSYHDDELIKDNFNRGAMAYVSKKEDIKIVVAAIKAVHKGKIFEDNIPELLKIKCFKDGHYYKLLYSEREKEIIHYICKGFSVKEISNILLVSCSAIETNLTIIYKKANVKNRQEFLSFALNNGLQFFGTKHL